MRDIQQKDIKAFPILIASDHAGFELKSQLLKEKQFFWKDLGCFKKERTDYPDWADRLCEKLKELEKPNDLISGLAFQKPDDLSSNLASQKPNALSSNLASQASSNFFKKSKLEEGSGARPSLDSKLKARAEAFGVLICGTGQGMAIRANRWKHIRASLCWNEEIAFLARSHNRANVLCLPGKFMDKAQALNILKTFLKTEFKPETAYKRRIKKLNKTTSFP